MPVSVNTGSKRSRTWARPNNSSLDHIILVERIGRDRGGNAEKTRGSRHRRTAPVRGAPQDYHRDGVAALLIPGANPLAGLGFCDSLMQRPPPGDLEAARGGGTLRDDTNSEMKQ